LVLLLYFIFFSRATWTTRGNQDILINVLEKHFGYNFVAGERYGVIENIDFVEEMENCEYIPPEESSWFSSGHGPQLKFSRNGKEIKVTMPDVFMSRKNNLLYWIEVKRHKNNSDDFIISDIEKINNKPVGIEVFSKGKGLRSFSATYNMLNIGIVDNEGKRYVVPVIADSSRQKYESDVKNFWNTDKQLAFRLRSVFANIQYGYAITSHKAQGSTYTNVYVFEDNILGPSNASNVKAKNQSLYVAVSRPTTKLVMISNKNQKSEIPQSFEDYTKEDSLLPPTTPSKESILKQFNELNNDGTQKRTLADTKDTETTRWNAMIHRAQKINKGQSYYKAKAIEVVMGNKVYYKLALSPREDVSLIDRMNSLTQEEVERRIQYCK